MPALTDTDQDRIDGLRAALSRASARVGAIVGGSTAMDATFAKSRAEARERGMDMGRYREIGHLAGPGSPA